MRELNDIRVTWQLAIVISVLFFGPIPLVAIASIIAEPGQGGATEVVVISALVLALGALLAAVAIRSRLAKLRDRRERSATLAQIGNGVLLLLAAATATALSYRFGTFSFLGSQWYLLPVGLYCAGLVMIGRAMVPEGQ